MIWEFVDVLGRRLVAWGVLSVVLAVPMLVAGDPFWRGVGAMFAAWGAVDAAIGAGARVVGERNRRRSIGDQAARDRELPRIRAILLVNVALDVGYVALGAWFLATAAGDAFRAGCGVGIVVQGGFLLLFDLLHAWWVPKPGGLLPPEVPLFEGPSHEPFRLRRADVDGDRSDARPARGALLLHGFTGTPAELRGLAAVLASDGWIVDVPRLPGHGPEIRDIADHSADEWVATALEAGRALRAEGIGELLVVGHSVGAALALATAAELRPDRVVVLAPFAWAVPPWQRLAGPVLRLVLPPGVRLFGRMNLDDPETRRGIEGFLPGLDLDDPSIVAGLRELRVPVRLFEQLFRVAAMAERAAPGVDVPVLAIQGLRDPVARPERTRELLAQLPAPPRVLELDAEHDLLTERSPVRDDVLRAILAFARG